MSKWGSPGELVDVIRVLPNTMLPMGRLFDLYDAVATVNREGLAGDIVECGVWNGGGIGLAGLANRQVHGPNRKLHIFDSFQGLPQPTEEDTDAHPQLRRKNADEADAKEALAPVGMFVGKSQAEVEDFLVKSLGLPKKELVFHVGWFQETIPGCADKIGDVAVLRLDGDWYESTKVCLEGLYRNVVKNGFVIIDDYGDFRGCKKAFDEFIASNSIVPNMKHSDSACVYFRKP